LITKRLPQLRLGDISWEMNLSLYDPYKVMLVDIDRTFLFDKVYYYDHDKEIIYYHRCTPSGSRLHHKDGKCYACEYIGPSYDKLDVIRGLKELVG